MSLHQRIECARVRLAGAMDRLAAAGAALRRARAEAEKDTHGRARLTAVRRAEADLACEAEQVRLRRKQLEGLLRMRQGDLFGAVVRTDGQEKTPPSGAG